MRDSQYSPNENEHPYAASDTAAFLFQHSSGNWKRGVKPRAEPIDEVAAGVLKEDGGDGPMGFGSPRNATPKAFKRLCSEALWFVMKAVAGMPAANSAL